MATLAAILDRLAIPRGVDQAASGIRTSGENPYRVRAIANEDIFFFTKRIDNTQVVRQADPQSGRACAWMIGSSMAGAVALVALMLPTLYGAFSGYKIEALRQERVRLVSERATLDLAEARILSPQHLKELAHRQSFVDPEPAKIVYLESNTQNTVARRIVVSTGDREQ